MPLKKPSEFYTLHPNTSLDEVKESATPEKVETISGAFNAFKTNLNHVQSISDFTNKFDTFEANIGKVEALSETVEDIRSNIQELINKEDQARLDDFTRVDMAMTFSPSASDTVRLNVENLTDETYYPHSHSTHQATVGEPINVRLSYQKTF